MQLHELTKVRSVARHWLAEQVSALDPGTIIEAVLLRNSRAAGMQFSAGPFAVRWLVGDDQLTVYENGQVPMSIDLNRSVLVKRAA